MPGNRYTKEEQVTAFEQTMRDRLKALLGVKDVATVQRANCPASQHLPLPVHFKRFEASSIMRRCPITGGTPLPLGSLESVS